MKAYIEETIKLKERIERKICGSNGDLVIFTLDRCFKRII
jgi:hypothetical protein